MDYLYTLGYDDDKSDGFDPMTTNIYVYVIADKYQVPPLQSLAASKFRVRATAEWNTKEFVNAVKTVYEFTHGPNSLRDAALEISKSHLSTLLMGETGFADMVGEVAELGKELLTGIFCRDGMKKWKCKQSHCGTEFWARKHAAMSSLRCSVCGYWSGPACG